MIDNLITRAAEAGLDLKLTNGRVQVIAQADANPSREFLEELRDNQDNIVRFLASTLLDIDALFRELERINPDLPAIPRRTITIRDLRLIASESSSAPLLVGRSSLPLSSKPKPAVTVAVPDSWFTPEQAERFRILASRLSALPPLPRAWRDFTDEIRYHKWHERVEAAKLVSPEVAFLVQAAAGAIAALAEPDPDLDVERGLTVDEAWPAAAKPGMVELRDVLDDPFVNLGLWD